MKTKLEQLADVLRLARELTEAVDALRAPTFKVTSEWVVEKPKRQKRKLSRIVRTEKAVEVPAEIKSMHTDGCALERSHSGKCVVVRQPRVVPQLRAVGGAA